MLGFLSSFSQSSDKDAYALGVEGILKVDSGNYKEGIKLLKQARNLEPQDYDYSFEIGKAYLKSGEPKKAEKYFYQLQYHTNVQPDLYILLSHCYNELEQLKKVPNPENKRTMDALRYGIQKLPNDGALYLELAKRNLELERPIEALSVLESGIKNDPNFAENYFWAAKLMAASGNNLWAWFYAEIFYNMTDVLELKRSAALIIAKTSAKVLAKGWKADPEKLDQDLAFVLSEKCNEQSSKNFENQFLKRRCVLSNWECRSYSISPLFDHMEFLDSKGWFEAYIWSILQESNKEEFLKWIPDNAHKFDEYRKWRFWNTMTLKDPVNRLQY